ncbi:immunity 42 family protein [Ralstonia solanacearum]|uniref:immunity 42 family protein n=1 Tax=Ralstonia solanacearum TaxID=305 RepID=UPI0023061A0C|nr:immunity 42 family protein [Ralstonia solanacearum]MDB0569134.1 immunity 42 family protein [Ralstonia solanacearum]
MIFGDPNFFSVWFDTVESWSTNSIKNGCLSYVIGGRFISTENSTIGVDIGQMSELECLRRNIGDGGIFDLPAREAYEVLCDRAFPSVDSGNNYSERIHLVSVGSLLDDGHNIFLLNSKSRARLICGRDGEPKEHVFDLILDEGLVESVIKESVDAWGAFLVKDF